MTENESLTIELLGAILQESVDHSAYLAFIIEHLARTKSLDTKAKGAIEQLAQDRAKRNLRVLGLIRRATLPEPK